MRLMRMERTGEQKYSVFDNRTQKPVTEDGPNERNEHFVLMLKDQYARAALMAYAQSAMEDGEKEYALDVMMLANRAGSLSKFCKRPD